MGNNVVYLHERRRPTWHAVTIEEPLPKPDSPWVIVACIIGSVLLNVGCLILLIAGGTP